MMGEICEAALNYQSTRPTKRTSKTANFRLLSLTRHVVSLNPTEGLDITFRLYLQPRHRLGEALDHWEGETCCPMPCKVSLTNRANSHTAWNCPAETEVIEKKETTGTHSVRTSLSQGLRKALKPSHRGVDTARISYSFSGNVRLGEYASFLNFAIAVSFHNNVTRSPSRVPA